MDYVQRCKVENQMSAGGTKGGVKNAKRMVLVRVDSGQWACRKRETLGQLTVLMDLQSD